MDERLNSSSPVLANSLSVQGSDRAVFGMKEPEWTEFQFLEHQLGVLDSKANNVLMVDSVLIVITTLTSLFQTGITPIVKEVATLATASVLVSVGLCIRVIWVSWATNLSKGQLIALRDRKTRFLRLSLLVLIVSLTLYLALLPFSLF